MIIPFYELKYHPFCISGVDVFLQKPSYNRLTITNRLYNGFIFIKSGLCRYTSKDGSFTISDGGAAYVPLGSAHELEILSDSIEFYRVDFTVNVNNEKVLFSTTPMKLSDNAPQECFYALSYLALNFVGRENTIEKTEKICTIFRLLWQPKNNTNAKRIEPALEYISRNATCPIDCKQLAKLCFLGTSQFYALFKQETKKTPLEYRNGILMREALMLLENTDCSISEISLKLGFQSMSYFNRFFKKYANCSPMKYRRFESL